MRLLCSRLILALLVIGPENRETMATFRFEREREQNDPMLNAH